MLIFNVNDLKRAPQPLGALTKCRNCELNTITQRINHVNVCDRADCQDAAEAGVFRLPDVRVKFI